MTYEEAITTMLRGGTIQHGGKTYRLGHGVQDVTDPENPTHFHMGDLSDDDRAATDWEAA